MRGVGRGGGERGGGPIWKCKFRLLLAWVYGIRGKGWKKRRNTGGKQSTAAAMRKHGKPVMTTSSACFAAEANCRVSGRREKKVKTHNLFAQSFALLVFRAGDTHAALFSCCCCCCPAPSDTGS